MEDLKPGVSVVTKNGDLLTPGQRVAVLKDSTMQGAIGAIAAEGEGGEKNGEIVRVQLDAPTQKTDDREADEASRWVYYAPDDLRLL